MYALEPISAAISPCDLAAPAGLLNFLQVSLEFLLSVGFLAHEPVAKVRRARTGTGGAAAIEAIARLDARVAATAAADAPLPTIDEAGSPSPAVPPKKRPIAYLNS